MNTHNVRFVWLKCNQTRNKMHKEIIIRHILIIFGRYSGIFPEKQGKGQQRGTNLNL